MSAACCSLFEFWKSRRFSSNKENIKPPLLCFCAKKETNKHRNAKRRVFTSAPEFEKSAMPRALLEKIILRAWKIIEKKVRVVGANYTE